jgi:hypothetical protein
MAIISQPKIWSSAFILALGAGHRYLRVLIVIADIYRKNSLKSRK